MSDETTARRAVEQERLMEDVDTGERVEVIAELRATVRSRRGDLRIARALVVAEAGCYHADVVAAFAALLAAPEPRQPDAWLVAWHDAAGKVVQTRLAFQPPAGEHDGPYRREVVPLYRGAPAQRKESE